MIIYIIYGIISFIFLPFFTKKMEEYNEIDKENFKLLLQYLDCDESLAEEEDLNDFERQFLISVCAALWPVGLLAALIVDNDN